MEIFQERRNRQGLRTHGKDLGQKKWLLLHNIILEQTLMLDDNKDEQFKERLFAFQSNGHSSDKDVSCPGDHWYNKGCMRKASNWNWKSKCQPKFANNHKRNIFTYAKKQMTNPIKYAMVDALDSTVVSTSARQAGQITRIGTDPIGSGTSVKACWGTCWAILELESNSQKFR